ncbi:MAG: PhzF family phenazine biosynthesis protein [Spirochaetales bacterium]|nr:PhzF family phenazine biosynthesis protein [Spirochaetales bacterium]
MEFYHVDVFSKEPLMGNGLSVVFVDTEIEDSILLKIAQEFKQFETIFIYPKENGVYPARIFTVEEELDFAGHPVIGAAGVISKREKDSSSKEVKLKIKNRILTTNVETESNYYKVSMNQGPATFISSLGISDINEIIRSLNLCTEEISKDYPIEVVSTGLKYLLLPVKDQASLAKARIVVSNFEEQLDRVGAKFVYIFEPQTLECRTWDNMGQVEDVATGSAAGPLCAYLVKNNFKDKGEPIIIKQGSFTGRPSIIKTFVEEKTDNVNIEGDVSFFAKGDLMLPAF